MNAGEVARAVIRPLSILIGEGFAGERAERCARQHRARAAGRPGRALRGRLRSPRPRAGHASFVVVARPNMPVKPPTLFVNKAEIRE